MISYKSRLLIECSFQLSDNIQMKMGQTQAQAVEELTLVTQEQQDMVKEKKTGQIQEQALEEATPVKQGVTPN
eukprot:Em0012g509a